MQKIDFDKFLLHIIPLGDKSTFPEGELSNTQIQGWGYLIDCLEGDIAVNDPRWAAYMLATAWHETAKTMHPVEEHGKGKGREYGKTDPQTGKTYYGRGYVQLTWKANYETFSRLLKVDLVNRPELACEPAMAYKILSIGMRRGLYTGVGLPRYFNEERNDPLNARKIVNGLDCAEKISRYHGVILEALHRSLT